MSNYHIFHDEFEDEGIHTPHLPLDWNEDLSLEEYLRHLEDGNNYITKSI